MKAKKARKAPANRRRKVMLTNVAPIAVKTTVGSKTAAIPVAIKTTGDSPEAEALIPVEVKNATGKSVKRAAKVPVRVRAAANSHNTRQSRSTRKQSAKSRRARNIHHRAKSHQQEPRASQQDLFTRSLVALTNAEETAVNLAGMVSISFLDTVPKWLRLGLSIPFELAEKATDRAQKAYSDASETVEELSSEASDALEEIAA